MPHHDKHHGDSQIRNAICGHAEWLRTFADCLETGSLEKCAEEISRDDQCEFGRWLKTLRADPQDPAMEKLEMITKLHRRFHENAGEIAGKVEAGHRHEAHAHFSSAAFKRVTNSLVLNLNDWRGDFQTLMS